MSKLPQLNGHEARLLGVLYEKERTVPEGYPLSVHALATGANQKSNREPMTDWSEAEILVGISGLLQKGLAGKVFPSGSRVEKYRHNARETLGLDDRKMAILAELLMRGPQTVGELRTRANRMTELGPVEAVLADLAALANGGFVRRVDPGPGSRVERWVQLLSPELHSLTAPSGADSGEARASAAEPKLQDRVASLEARVEVLERALKELGAL